MATEPEERQEQANIHQRLLAVIRDAQPVEKAGKSPEGYAYQKVDDVVDALRPLFVKHGVLMIPTVTGHNEQRFTETAYNYKQKREYERTVTVSMTEMEIAFVNVDKPTDRFTLEVCAQGNSYSDKAPTVSYSYSLKCALLGLCQLRGQPDAEAQEVPTPAEAREQVKEQRKAELDAEEKQGPTEIQLELAGEWEKDPRLKELSVPDHDNINGFDVIRKVILNGKRGNRKQVQGVLDWLAEELGVPQIQAAKKPDASPKAGDIKGFQPPAEPRMGDGSTHPEDIADDDIPF